MLLIKLVPFSFKLCDKCKHCSKDSGSPEFSPSIIASVVLCDSAVRGSESQKGMFPPGGVPPSFCAVTAAQVHAVLSRKVQANSARVRSHPKAR